MNLQRLPLFKSHYSIGKSILTLNNPKDVIENGPNSIIKLALDHQLKEVYLVEDGMSGFLEAYIRCKENNLKLGFGLRMNYVCNVNEKTEDSKKAESKIIVFVKTKKGYKLINKIYATAYREGFYFYPRVDTNLLSRFWSNEDLLLAIPFYDSGIFNNLFTFAICSPDFSFAKGEEFYFVEDNKLWFDEVLYQKILNFCRAENRKMLITQSVYYTKPSDFKAYLTLRCISKKTVLEKPELPHMSSNTFCFENCSEPFPFEL